MLQRKYWQTRLREDLVWVVVQSSNTDSEKEAGVSSDHASACYWCMILYFNFSGLRDLVCEKVTTIPTVAL